jgi:DNA helicase-2/ATP-dependent DNA helicase PcrA
MVDEYQDTNHLQADIVAELAGPKRNVMAVGDDAQSIYGFRGASFQNIMTFPDRFPGTQIITLEENYRSTQPILDLTNAIIARAAERYSKTLFTRRTSGLKPLLVPAPDDRVQSFFVRQRLLELHEEGVPLSEIAVLFRSSFHSFDLELELTRCGIPFVKRGGVRFIETAHVKDVLAHLRIVHNPRDAVSLHRVLLLLEGVGPKAATAIVEAMDGGEVLSSRLAEIGSRRGVVRPGAAAALVGLRDLLAALEGMDAKPVQMVQQVVKYYRPILERVHRDDAPKRLRDLEQFEVIAERYRSLGQLLADMALEPPGEVVDDVVAPDTGTDELLTLSTVHSAKGLEWHTVFVISVADGHFPSSYSAGDEELEEERRLLYVACTRARDNLILTYPVSVHDRAFGRVVARPSRFLDHLPSALFEPITLIEEE